MISNYKMESRSQKNIDTYKYNQELKKSGFSFLFVYYNFLLSSKTQLIILFSFEFEIKHLSSIFVNMFKSSLISDI